MNPQTYAVVLVSENNIIYIPITWLNCESQDTPFIGNNYTFYWPLVDAVKEANNYATIDRNWTKRSGKLLNVASKKFYKSIFIF